VPPPVLRPASSPPTLQAYGLNLLGTLSEVGDGFNDGTGQPLYDPARNLGCSIPGYVPGYEGMYPPPEGMLSIPWAQGMVKCTLIKH